MSFAAQQEYTNPVLDYLGGLALGKKQVSQEPRKSVTQQTAAKNRKQTTINDVESSDGVFVEAAADAGEDAEVIDSEESDRGQKGYGAFAPMHAAAEIEPSAYQSRTGQQLGASVVSDSNQMTSKQKPNGRGRQVNTSFKSKR